MQNTGSLQRQQDEQFLHGDVRGIDDPQPETLRACDHLSKQLIDNVGVDTGALGDACPQQASHAPQVTGRQRCSSVLWIVGENSTHVLVVVGRPVPGEVGTFGGVVLLERMAQAGNWNWNWPAS